MEYMKPTLVRAGSAQVLVLGIRPGSGDHNPPTLEGNTKPFALAMGLDD